MSYITHTADLIYGLGESENDAYANAREELGAAQILLLSDDENITWQYGSWMRAGTLRTTPCTPALAALVETHGGDCTWCIVNGVADVAP